jgi:hypothetical protein
MKKRKSLKKTKSSHPLYSIWSGIRSRCNNEKNTSFKYYGARGINICGRWDSFELFAKDMGKRPQGATIDRINNDGNYEPLNCRWATSKVQCKNKGVSSDNKSGFTGIKWVDDSGLWRVSIGHNCENISIGTTREFDIAVRMRWEAEKYYDYSIAKNSSVAFKYLKKKKLLNDYQNLKWAKYFSKIDFSKKVESRI